MTKKRLKRIVALVMALVLTAGAVIPSAAYANATGPGAETAAGSDGNSRTEVEQEPVLYNETERTDLEPVEIVEAEDIIVAAGYGFDVEKSFDGLSYDEQAVKVSYYTEKGVFDGDKPGDYTTYYKAEPASGKPLILSVAWFPCVNRRRRWRKTVMLPVTGNPGTGSRKRKMMAAGRRNLPPVVEVFLHRMAK